MISIRSKGAYPLLPRIRLTRIVSLLAAFVAAQTISFAAEPISFAARIQPVFEKSCWKCHSGAVQLAKLDLSSRASALNGGDHGAVLVPGDATKSKLYRMAAGLDKPAMPLGGKLTQEEIEAIRVWINQGAAWDSSATPTARTQLDAIPDPPIPPEARQAWPFRLPVRPHIPGDAGLGDTNRKPNPIDAFLDRALAAKGLRQAPTADRRTLIRRAYLDLIGLPPKPDEVETFLNDRAPDAWDKLVDRLLANPHYGERWGRHWLDVARYADSNGFEHDFDRPNAWRYRDYVIRAFNQDTPYNQFLREQIAGDEFEHPTYDNLIATGFLRNYAKVGFREKDNPEFRYEYLDDMIATLGRGVLGLTVQCARCHDHKFDPIRQADYYRLQASLWGYVEVDHPLVPSAEAEAYRAQTALIDGRIRELRRTLAELEQPYRDRLLPAKYKRYPQNIQDALATPESLRTPGQVLLANQVIRSVSVSSNEIDRVMTPEDLAEKRRLNEKIAEASKLRPKPIPMAAGITDGDYRFTPDGPGDEPAPGKGKKREALEGSYLHQGPGLYKAPPSHFLIRGDVNARGPETRPGFVQVATYGNPPTELPPASGQTSGRRLALAEWLVSPENPLTARVMVNRIWHHHFGRGIVPTLDNFGKMGEPPSNPELLDWLAVEFREQGWSIKKIHRLIMTSNAYRMASRFEDGQDQVKDPSNSLLWRYPQRRLDAEIIRDQMLAVSGGLNPEIEGPPIFPAIPDEVRDSMKYGIWEKKDDGPEVWKRSVYVYRKRGLPLPLFEVFDLPNQNVVCGARNVTTVPTQALALMNDEFVARQATLFAGRITEAAPDDRTRQIDLAYQIALARPPEPSERAAALAFTTSRSLADLAHVIFNLNEFVYLR